MSQSIATQSSQTKDQIPLAIEALKQGHYASVRSATNAYDVPESTLRYHLYKHSRQRSAMCKLTEIEESTLVQ
jgi:hypothetical protein